MRIAAVFILILLSVTAKSQTTTSTQYLGGPSTLVINRGVFQVDSAFKNAIRDTTFTPTRIGVQVFRSADSSLYVSTSITAATKWTRLGTNSGSATWGTITGTLSSQNDLATALTAKQNTITTGTTAQYFKGDFSLGTFSSDVTSVTDPLYEAISNKATDFTTINNTLYPTTQAVSNYITSIVSGYVPTSRTLTINGTTYDLSANRSWTISTATPTLNQVLHTGNTGDTSIVLNTESNGFVGFSASDDDGAGFFWWCTGWRGLYVHV